MDACNGSKHGAYTHTYRQRINIMVTGSWKQANVGKSGSGARTARQRPLRRKLTRYIMP